MINISDILYKIENYQNDINIERIINKVFPNIYVISVNDSNKYRYNYIKSVMNKLGANYSLCIMNRPSDSVSLSHPTLTKGELGICMSNIWVLNHIIDNHNDDEINLILEDDIMPLINFDSYLEEFINENPNFISSLKLWQLLCNDYTFYIQNNDINKKWYLPISKIAKPTSCAAYAFRKEIAKQLIIDYQTFSKPVDLYFKKYYMTSKDLEMGVFYPPLFLADRTTSTIENHEKLLGSEEEQRFYNCCFPNLDKNKYYFVSLINLKYKIAVVSCLFTIEIDKLDNLGLFDKIKEIDYILYTNNINNELLDTVRHLWDIREIKLPYKNGVYYTKYVKWLTHLYLPEYDYIIWVDSFISPKEEILNYINYMDDNNIIIAMRTQKFNNVYCDINWCSNNKRITGEMKDSIIEYLNKNNFDVNEQSDTFWSSAMIKNNISSQLQLLSMEIFHLIVNVGYRDQHWLPYLFNKYNIQYEIINKNLFINSGIQCPKNHNYIDFIF
jgi:GR25 family glycosyltransferase involved in LPS biosynthesis